MLETPIVATAEELGPVVLCSWIVLVQGQQVIEELDRIPRASAYVRTKALEWTAEMYDDWNDVAPGAGHAESAAEYRARATTPE